MRFGSNESTHKQSAAGASVRRRDFSSRPRRDVNVAKKYLLFLRIESKSFVCDGIGILELHVIKTIIIHCGYKKDEAKSKNGAYSTV